MFCSNFCLLTNEWRNHRGPWRYLNKNKLWRGRKGDLFNHMAISLIGHLHREPSRLWWQIYPPIAWRWAYGAPVAWLILDSAVQRPPIRRSLKGHCESSFRRGLSWSLPIWCEHLCPLSVRKCVCSSTWAFSLQNVLVWRFSLGEAKIQAMWRLVEIYSNDRNHRIIWTLAILHVEPLGFVAWGVRRQHGCSRRWSVLVDSAYYWLVLDSGWVHGIKG